MRKLTKYEKVFTNITKKYVRLYPEHSFKFYFDDIEYPVIGKSKNVVSVKFKKSPYLFRRIFREGSLGLGESYCEGLIDVADKDYKWLLYIFVRAANDGKLIWKLSWMDLFRVMKARTAGRFFARESQHANINAHYSLSDWFDNDDYSNQFYMYWLDHETYQYSCAKWDPETKGLVESELNKFDYYCKRLGIDKNSKGKTLLDLGCGWGGFSYYVAEKYGLKVTAMTLSTAQTKFIKDQIKKRKLQNKITILNENAHNMKGKYDYIASIGLLEHIDDYDDLYKKASRALNPGGTALFHAMFNKNPFYKPDPFLLKYIFPGGGTPNFKSNVRVFKKYFKYVDPKSLPPLSYPKTLDCWYDLFCKNESKIKKLLKEKGKVKNVDYATRIFKHYLMLASTGLAVKGYVYNILAKN